ncbi:uncharacterized protein LOC101042760 isoform X3 [Saimiri boliviensis]|uniref:uncharacterized protein LOC101042760 isoform X3 n=1 Tax=Saimiri boliviensis TaxID=27679 RepID=UPI000533C645|nr:UDP-GalNAc:beta-1,3-N-acetylgalactosaminyltransferase 1 isoform X4 [Saimiri boliviensis boliviensis]
MQGDPEDPESVPSGRAGLRAQDARPRPQRVVCARSAVRAPAGRVRVCARRERRTPSRFRAGCALCSGGRYPCLRLPAAVQPRSNPVATRGVCSGAEEEDANGVNGIGGSLTGLRRTLSRKAGEGPRRRVPAFGR